MESSHLDLEYQKSINGLKGQSCWHTVFNRSRLKDSVSRRFVFPERRFVAGFFRRLLAYLTPHISHTYPAHHTYPTHIHSKRIPPIRIPPTRIPPICIRSTTRIPPIRIHAMRIHSKVVHQQESQTYPTNTYPTNTYLQHVSHQYGSIECVSIQKVCISRNGNEYEYHCIIAYHFIPLLLGGNCNEYRNLAYPSISLQYY